VEHGKAYQDLREGKVDFKASSSGEQKIKLKKKVKQKKFSRYNSGVCSSKIKCPYCSGI